MHGYKKIREIIRQKLCLSHDLSMQFVADLHLHSKYSRAVSRDMILPTMSAWAKKKGIDILSTADWTHPLWFREIRNQLEEKSEGLFQLKSEIRPFGSAQGENSKSETNSNDKNPNVEKDPLFLLSVEVSSIYSQGGKLRRIHNLIFSPSFETAEKINKELLRRGVNLMSDGRPIMGISSKDLLELVLTIDKNVLFVPCHAWTPWFSLYGSNSGFDSIDECFGDYSKFIYAVETGLSSDPEMNWRIKELENRSILSFSDAHSPAKMGREATVFELAEPSYENIRVAIMRRSVIGSQLSVVGSKSVSSQSTGKRKTDQLESENRKPKTDNRIIYTIEFYPEEGKYHYTGHRNCRVVQKPEETKEKGTICPVCKRQLTVGVMHRVEQLARLNSQQTTNNSQLDDFGVRWIEDPSRKHPKFVKLVPLLEIVAEALASTVASQKVMNTFTDLCSVFGSEIQVLLFTPIDTIADKSSEKIAEGVAKVRRGDIVIDPGFDGEYGKVKIWNEDDSEAKTLIPVSNEENQLGLF